MKPVNRNKKVLVIHLARQEIQNFFSSFIISRREIRNLELDSKSFRDISFRHIAFFDQDFAKHFGLKTLNLKSFLQVLVCDKSFSDKDFTKALPGHFFEMAHVWFLLILRVSNKAVITAHTFSGKLLYPFNISILHKKRFVKPTETASRFGHCYSVIRFSVIKLIGFYLVFLARL